MADFKKTVTAMVKSGADLGMRQVAILYHLQTHAGAKKQERREVRSVASDLGISKPAVTRNADGLQADGLIVRESVAADRRCCALALTPKGVEFLAKINSGFAAAA